mmetsp:Transcript_12288/g.42639  ORF Transcript_12288/g.42639 Transcript_12288/m.42639 type:complete len:89 (+) Transcript_12288:3-269(+)
MCSRDAVLGAMRRLPGLAGGDSGALDDPGAHHDACSLLHAFGSIQSLAAVAGGAQGEAELEGRAGLGRRAARDVAAGLRRSRGRRGGA